MRIGYLVCASTIGIASLIGLATWPSMAHAQNGSAQGARQKPGQTIIATVDFEQVEIRDALRDLFKQVGISYTIAPEIQGRVSVFLHNVTFDTALSNVIKQVDGSFRVEGGIYVIEKHEEAPLLASSSDLVLRIDNPDKTLAWGLNRLTALGFRTRIEGGIYYLITESGRTVGRLAAPGDQTEPPKTSTISQDEKYLYVLRGNLLSKVQKSDLKVITNTLLPR